MLASKLPDMPGETLPALPPHNAPEATQTATLRPSSKDPQEERRIAAVKADLATKKAQVGKPAVKGFLPGFDSSKPVIHP